MPPGGVVEPVVLGGPCARAASGAAWVTAEPWGRCLVRGKYCSNLGPKFVTARDRERIPFAHFFIRDRTCSSPGVAVLPRFVFCFCSPDVLFAVVALVCYIYFCCLVELFAVIALLYF